MDELGFDLGEEEENLAVMTVVFTNDYGEQEIFRTEIPTIDVYQQIYLEPDNRIVHRKYMGHAPDGKKHYRYTVDYEKESFDDAASEFAHAGWLHLSHDS